MPAELSLYIFIDAMGWEVIKHRPFCPDILEHRQPVTSVLGYSSTCLPSIFTGLSPAEHGHFSFFYYAPGSSPFRPLRYMQYLPGFVFNRARIRSRLSKAYARLLGWTGYFDIYATPWPMVDQYDTCEKANLFSPTGLDGLPTIFSILSEKRIPYHCSDWRASEEHNIQSLISAVDAAKIRMGFLYTASLDGLMHQVGPDDARATEKIAMYADRIEQIYRLATRRYDRVKLRVFSDHGMAMIHQKHDMIAHVESSGLRIMEDYIPFYDSTMARFWVFNNRAQERLAEILEAHPAGRLLPDDELLRLGCLFKDRRFGDLIFVCHQGHLIVPSYMGLKPIPAMHGYHPSEPASMASLQANDEPAIPVHTLLDLHRLMLAETT